MRERRLTVALLVLLILAIGWDHRPAASGAVDAALTDRAAVTAEAAVDLGTVALSWTARRLAPR